jgi:nascent polypeptide-associated complex subunit alpha
MDPKKISGLMKSMGIKTEEIQATEVVIKTAGKELVVKNPQVTAIDFSGQKSFQIMGTVEERVSEGASEEDVALVAEKTGATKEKARKALKEAKGDIAEAIMALQG